MPGEYKESHNFSRGSMSIVTGCATQEEQLDSKISSIKTEICSLEEEKEQLEQEKQKLETEVIRNRSFRKES